MKEIVDLAQQLARSTPDPKTFALRQATVQTVSAWPFSIQIRFPGSTVDVPAKFLDSYRPVAGDIVWVIQNGPDLVVLGDLGPSSTLHVSGDATVGPAQVRLNDTKSGQATPNKYLRSVNGNFEVVNNAYNAVIMALSDTGKLWLPTNVAHEMGSLEIGQRGVGNTPYVDFHSGATDVDFDARIIASGGSGATGGGTIKIEAANIWLGGDDVSTWSTYTPTTTGLTSGAASGKWRWVSPDVIHLVLTITAGTLTNNTVLPTLSLPSGFTTMSSYTQPLKAMFNAVQLLNTYCLSAATVVNVSHSNAVGTAYANGTSYAGVRITGTLARD